MFKIRPVQVCSFQRMGSNSLLVSTLILKLGEVHIRNQQQAPSADTHQGRDLFVSQDGDGLIMTAGALLLPLISEFRWCLSLCIHVMNTSPVVIVCQSHYVVLVKSLWHCYKPESHGPVFIKLLVSFCCT